MTLDPAVAAGSRKALATNLAAVKAAMAAACGRSGRPPSAATLLPVVKYVGADMVRLLHGLGERDFAENTVQGWEAKREVLPDLDARWHMIGHLQRNKARKAVAAFESIHSLDSDRLAARIEEEIAARDAGTLTCQAPGALHSQENPRLYVEVNIAGEATKGGIAPEEAPAFLERLRAFPRVAARLAGLMGMAPEADDPEAARPHFRRLRELRDRLAGAGLLPPDAGLSMGMSADFIVAVEEGATVVRVGTRLFEGVETPGGLGCR